MSREDDRRWWNGTFLKADWVDVHKGEIMILIAVHMVWVEIIEPELKKNLPAASTEFM